MSGFFNDTNKGRVEKMRSTLEVMDKSARSNKATAEQWAELLQPVVSFIAVVTEGVYDPTSTTPEAAQPARSKPHYWNDVRAMAEEADLHDLTFAMAVFLNRIDEQLKGN